MPSQPPASSHKRPYSNAPAPRKLPARAKARSPAPLALGTAVCAGDLTAVLADHKNITTQQQISDLVAARRDRGAPDTAMPDLLLAVRADDPGQAAELLSNLMAGDQDAFLDLIVELGGYAATCVSLPAVLEISPVEDTLAELTETVQQFFADKQPSHTGAAENRR
ncbi:hypothetical protein ACWCXK_37310 [Streptomyces sp. NPDC001739]